MKNAHMYAPIKRQIQIPITLFCSLSRSPFRLCLRFFVFHSHSLSLSLSPFRISPHICCYLSSIPLLFMWPVSYMYATFTINPHTHISKETLTLFNAYLQYDDWNETSTKWEWVSEWAVNDVNVNAKENGYSPVRSFAIPCSQPHTQSPAQTDSQMKKLFYIDRSALLLFYFIWLCHLKN